MKYSRKNTIPETVKEKIAHDYQNTENSSLKMIADKYGTSVASVTAILDEKNVARNSRGRRKGSTHFVKIDPSLHTEIVKRYENGESTVQLAPEYNVSRQAICDILKKSKSPKYIKASAKRKTLKNLSEETKKKIVEEYIDSKISISKMAEKWDLNSFGLRKILKDAGIEVRAAGFYHTKIHKTEYAAIKKRYLSGERLPSIAKDYDVSPGCVEIVLKKLGVPSQHKKRLQEYYEKCRKVPVQEYKKILKKRNNDKQTVASLSEEYDVSYGGMELILKRAGKMADEGAI